MPSQRRFERTDRVSALIQEVVATEVEQLDDERLAGVVITGVQVDREFTTAVIFYDIRNQEDADHVAETLEQQRHRLQRELGSSTKLRRTPALRFKLDTSLADAERIERLLEDL